MHVHVARELSASSRVIALTVVHGFARVCLASSRSVSAERRFVAHMVGADVRRICLRA